jgi:RNA polymerase sigma-B factor
MNQSHLPIASSRPPQGCGGGRGASGASPAAARRNPQATLTGPALSGAAITSAAVAPARLAALGRALRQQPAGLSLAQRNRIGLEQLAQCRDHATRVVLRNALVHSNLPLAYAVSSRLGRSQALPQEDLCQIASLGLLRAIEAFRPDRGRSLSSFAVPYIRGAIQQELRDRSSLVRIPRELWELRRRATLLLERQRRRAGVGLGADQLAAALGCAVSKVVEALSLSAVTEIGRLDAPRPGAAEGDAGSLLDGLADPASLVPSDGDDQGGAAAAGAAWRSAAALIHDPAAAAVGAAAAAGPDSGADSDPLTTRAEGSCSPDPLQADRTWLRQCLSRLQPQQRQLLVGHICLGSSWVELGHELGLHPRQAQRLTLALLSRLREEGRQWQAGQQATAAANGD